MDNNLDKIFKKNLDREFEFSGQAEQWLTLEKKLDNRNDKRWFWVYMLIPVSLILVLMIAFLDFGDAQKLENLDTSLISETSKTPDEQAEHTTESYSNSETQLNYNSSPTPTKTLNNKISNNNSAEKPLNQYKKKYSKNTQPTPVVLVENQYNSSYSSTSSAVKSENTILFDTLLSENNYENDSYNKSAKIRSSQDSAGKIESQLISYSSIKNTNLQSFNLPDFPLNIYSNTITTPILISDIERKIRVSAGVRNFWYNNSEIIDTTTSSRLVIGLAYRAKKNIIIGASFYRTTRYLKFTSNPEAYNIEFNGNGYENASLLESEAEYLAYHADIFTEYRILNKGVFGLSPKVGFRLSRYSKAIEYHTIDYNYVRTVIQESSESRDIHISRLILGLTGNIDITDRIGVLLSYEYLHEIQSPFIKLQNLQSIKGEVYYWF